jgi:hypothetical protein
MAESDIAVGTDEAAVVTQAAAGIDDVGDVALALVLVRLDERLAQAADDASGVVEVEQEGADAVRRIGPTPWLITSQPASVSIGEPQLPILDEFPGEPA